MNKSKKTGLKISAPQVQMPNVDMDEQQVRESMNRDLESSLAFLMMIREDKEINDTVAKILKQRLDQVNEQRAREAKIDADAIRDQAARAAGRVQEYQESVSGDENVQ